MTGGYKGLEGNTLCLQGVRRGDRGLKRVTGGYNNNNNNKFY